MSIPARSSSQALDLSGYSTPGIAIVSVAIFLSYIEPLQIGGLKVAVAWKAVATGVIVIVLAMRFIHGGNSLIQTTTALCLLSLSIIPLLSATMDLSPGESLRVAAQRVFPLAVLLYASSSRGLRIGVQAVLATPLIIGLASIPFAAGWIAPLGESYRYFELYGLSHPGFVGVFQNAHAASVALALAAIVALWQVLRTDSRKLAMLNGAALALLAILTVQTYARTGMAIGLAGFAIVVWQMRRGRGARVLAVISAGLCGVLIVDQGSGAGLVNRLIGKTVYSSQYSINTVDRLASGRITFMTEALAAWSDGGPLIWVVGLGYGGMERALLLRVGYSIPSHNGFVDALVATGIVGLSVLLMVLWALYRDLQFINNPELRALGLAFIGAWTVYLVVQGGELPLHFTFVAVPFALLAARGRGLIQ